MGGPTRHPASDGVVTAKGGEPLARKHRGGRLHPLDGARVFYEPPGSTGRS